MIRDEILRFCSLGPLPGATRPDLSRLQEIGAALDAIKPPVSDEEARLLVAQFGPDECYGLAWTLLHLIETAPGWPMRECTESSSNEWILRLKSRAERKKP
jgi:hypothetical protein